MAEFEYDKERARHIARALYAVFTWDNTEQGSDFWFYLYKAFKHLAYEDELEFEERIETAVSRYEPRPASKKFVYDKHLASAMCYEIACVFSWHNAPFPEAWAPLCWAFHVLSRDDVEGFNQYVSTFVEKVRG